MLKTCQYGRIAIRPFPIRPNNINPLSQSFSAPQNNYQYNGKEFTTDFGLHWNDYGARWYDAQVGRWWVVDPLAEKYMAWSGYNYVMDNPINFIDPTGQEGEAIVDKENKTVTVHMKFHISQDDIRGLKKGKLGPQNLMELTAQFNEQFTNRNVKVDDETYDVSFNIEFQVHDTNENKLAAFKADKGKGTSANLFVLKESFGTSIFDDSILTYSSWGADKSTFSHEVGHGLGLDHPASAKLARSNPDKYQFLMYGKTPYFDQNEKKTYIKENGSAIGPLMSYYSNRYLTNKEVSNIIKPAVNYPNTLSRRKRKKIGNIYTVRIYEN